VRRWRYREDVALGDPANDRLIAAVRDREPIVAGVPKSLDRGVESVGYGAPVADRRTETHIFLEHAHTFEGVGSRVSEIAHELAEQGCVVSSVSHTIDVDDPAGRYQVIVIGLPIDASPAAN
jgi:hypothetical protein